MLRRSEFGMKPNAEIYPPRADWAFTPPSSLNLLFASRPTGNGRLIIHT